LRLLSGAGSDAGKREGVKRVKVEGLCLNAGP
jgi:hypothetical protein